MLRVVLIFILFIASQMLAALISLISVNWDKISTGSGIDWLRAGEVPPTILGISYWVAYLFLFLLIWQLAFISQHPIGNVFRRSPYGGRSLVVFFLVISIGISLALYPFGLDDGGVSGLFLQMRNNGWALSLMCLGAPLIEEVVFRDGIQRNLLQAGLHPWAAILVASAAFAVTHLNWAQMVPAFLLGIFLGWLYQRTGDLRLCIPAHVLNNTLACLEMHFPSLEDRYAALPAWLLFLLGGLLLFGGIWGFRRAYVSQRCIRPPRS